MSSRDESVLMEIGVSKESGCGAMPDYAESRILWCTSAFQFEFCTEKQHLDVAVSPFRTLIQFRFSIIKKATLRLLSLCVCQLGYCQGSTMNLAGSISVSCQGF